jgi:hypothetical protein
MQHALAVLMAERPVTHQTSASHRQGDFGWLLQWATGDAVEARLQLLHAAQHLPWVNLVRGKVCISETDVAVRMLLLLLGGLV